MVDFRKNNLLFNEIKIIKLKKIIVSGGGLINKNKNKKIFFS